MNNRLPFASPLPFALRATVLASLLTLAACGGSDDDSYATPSAPAGLGQEAVAAAPDVTVPTGRTDIPPRRIHAAVDSAFASRSVAALKAGQGLDAGYALNNAGYPSGSAHPCYADEKTNLSIRPLAEFLKIWMPTPSADGKLYMDAHESAIVAGSVTTKEGVTFDCPAIPTTTWTGIPGAATDGTVLNKDLHDLNLKYSAQVTSSSYRTAPREVAAYLDDARGKNYSVSTGLGPLAGFWHTLAQQQSYVDGIPTNGACPNGATSTYPFCSAPDDETYNVGKGASTSLTAAEAANANFGKAVNFILTATNDGTASTNPTKYFYKYARPYRWYDAGLTPHVITVPPSLLKAQKDASNNSASKDIIKDSDFPSGHTAEAVRGGLAYAYLVPQRFQYMVARGLELGNNRIVAGMHSALAVMGGRINGEVASLNLINNKMSPAVREAAYAQAQDKLRAAAYAATGDASVRTDAGFHAYAQSNNNQTADLTLFETPFADHATLKRLVKSYLTFNFPQDLSKAGQPAVVPEGAETLLETRLPYLSAEQRRVVLKTTALDSGYPVLDDEEGHGRLNYFDAADGYGAFTGDVAVTMNAGQGGFHAFDAWRNDISGAGKLTKRGSGTLALTGANTYSGGTIVSGGTLRADSAAAFGTGAVYVDGGTLATHVSGHALQVHGTYTQTSGGTLSVALDGSGAGQLAIADQAALAGTLTVTFRAGYTPSVGTTVTVLNAAGVHGRFDNVNVPGFKATPIYSGGNVAVRIDALG
jgi:autotransporter-associated beta strand protein